MNEICRLCLTVSSEIMNRLYDECEILCKIRSCMSVQVALNDSLPNQICQICIKKINDIHEFHAQITQNEQKLIHHLTSGKDNFQYLYEDTKSNTKIKDEKEETIEHILSETHDNLINQVIKKDANYSTDDEISLSIIKEEKKDVNLTKTYNKKKTKKKMRIKHKIINNKESLKKKRQEAENIELNCLTCFQHFETQIALIKHYYNDHITSVNSENNDKIVNPYNDNSQIDIGNLKADDDNKHTVNDNSAKDEEIKKAINDNSKPDNSSKKLVSANSKVKKHNKYRRCSENGKIIYECSVCMKQCEKKKDIDRHITTHDSNRPFLCKLCGRTYKTVYEIIRHGRAHGGVKLHCSHKCGFSTAYRGALKEHELRHGVLEYKYTCEKCGKGFQAKTWYEQHQNIHTGLKPFVCDICGLGFHMDRYLTAHRSSVHPQTAKVKRYVCIHCSLPCDSKNSLKRHMEEHGIKSTFLCDLCGRVFTNADVLKYHKNGHLGIKPHTCSVCQKTFAKKFNLKIHELTHTGERSHVCVKCGKHFTQRSTLLRHNRRHHPENQYKDVSVAENAKKTD